ncbi:hypothetical protein LWI29_038483 [Acer saccharum]|uniref:RNase H type-1 domain-containing protein n=1 Tax=Acer saccharum TaxID=4024 RepID=A0AA39SBI8_ACESA|nr:hypothetical protein LWI29_038483 [Acer saccharum]
MCRLGIIDFCGRRLWLVSVGCADVVRKFIVTAWLKWHCRNVLLFGTKDCVLSDFWCRAGEFLSYYTGSVVNNIKRRNDVGNGQVWAVPLLGWYKMNVDSVIAKEKSGAGLLCRNDKGVVIGASTLVFEGLISVEVVEVRAILEGLLLAVNNGWLPLCIESDALGVKESQLTVMMLIMWFMIFEILLDRHRDVSLSFEYMCFVHGVNGNCIAVNCLSLISLS